MKVVYEYFLRQAPHTHFKISTQEIATKMNLTPRDTHRLGHFLRSASFSRNNLGFHVSRCNGHAADDKSGIHYSITLRPTFEDIAEKVLGE